MRFLTVADRELRAAARRKATYRTRWLTATIFFGLLIWLMWAFRGFSNARASTEIFQIFSSLTLLYCVFLGTARTADCISGERREGTLGLLFLSNLNSAEIIGGKLCSTALSSVYGFMAIFPMLALPLLMGGITFNFFARTVVALLNAMGFALTMGFLASVICRRQFMAIATAMGLAVGVGGGLILAAAAFDSYVLTQPLAEWFAMCSPLYGMMTADGSRPFGVNHFWESTAVVAGMSLAGLLLTVLLLAKSWRDRVATSWTGLLFKRRSERAASQGRAVLRHRLLKLNPYFWLSARQRVSAPFVMCVFVAITLVTEYVAAPFFARVMGGGAASRAVLGHLFSWFWAGLAIHALVLYYAAMTASQRLAEDKQSGALELILCSPITEREISRGLWLGFWRRMLFPVTGAVLVHFFFLWQVMVMAILDPPGMGGRVPVGVGPWQLLWHSLLDRPVGGFRLAWEFGFLVRVALLTLFILMISWPTLGLVGRWLGVRMKHPGFAPVASLALLAAPPVLIFSFACYLADEFNLDRLPERRFLPMMMWLGVAIGLLHCAVLSTWASSHLRQHLRRIALSRFEPLPGWRWRLPSWRLVRRVAVATVLLVTVVATLVSGYYKYQNWRSKNVWRSFEHTLKQRGESLELSHLMPTAVQDTANFARSQAYARYLANRGATRLFDRWASRQPAPGVAAANSALMRWSQQKPSLFDAFLSRAGGTSNGYPSSARSAQARAILEEFGPYNELLTGVSTAAANLPCFQVSTQTDAAAFFHPDKRHITALGSLHLAYQIRASAFIEVDQSSDAFQDVLTGLRLVNYSRQIPDSRASSRSQGLLARSLQPVWEALGRRAWDAAEVATIQASLQEIDLLADFTNNVHRAMRAHIGLWRQIPGSPGAPRLPVEEGWTQNTGWELQPRAWWFENCLQLYASTAQVLSQVDPQTGRVKYTVNWSDFNGLPLDPASRELLQQGWWWGANSAGVSFALTSLNQAILACAIERFRLEHDAYPSNLDELVPAFLQKVPRDASSGRPLIYQSEGNRILLRGVGPDGLDDRRGKGSDDWLWAYSTNTPAMQR